MKARIILFLFFMATHLSIAQNLQTEVFDEFKLLYKELKSFKNSSDFRKYGFTKSGPYNHWLVRVENLKTHPDANSLLSMGFVAGELEVLGLTYVSSKGRETETTLFFNKIFSEAISNQ
jgi:hypothetical protein